jgi:hypothetical protein
VTFDPPRYAGGVLALRMHVMGLSEQEMTATANDGAKPRARLQIHVLDSQGLEAPATVGVGSQNGVLTLEVLASRVGPGDHRLAVSLDGAGSFEREIEVP